jgi:hypothetical protein
MCLKYLAKKRAAIGPRPAADAALGAVRGVADRGDCVWGSMRDAEPRDAAKRQALRARASNIPIG